MCQVACNPRQWGRFVLAGLVNSSISYGCYWVLATQINYQAAYLIAYALGIIVAYVLNARFVFRVSCSWHGFFAYPIVYLVQYLISATMLEGFVSWLGLSQWIAPLVVIIAMVPKSYLINKIVLRHQHVNHYP